MSLPWLVSNFMAAFPEWRMKQWTHIWLENWTIIQMCAVHTMRMSMGIPAESIPAAKRNTAVPATGVSVFKIR